MHRIKFSGQLFIVDLFWLLVFFQKVAFVNQTFEQKFVVAVFVFLSSVFSFLYLVAHVSKFFESLKSQTFRIYLLLVFLLGLFLIFNLTLFPSNLLESQISLSALLMLITYGILFPSIIPLNVAVNRAFTWASFFVLVNIPYLFDSASYFEGRWGGIFGNPAIFGGILPYLSAIFVFLPRQTIPGFRSFMNLMLIYFCVASGSRSAFALAILLLFLNIFLGKKNKLFGISISSWSRSVVAFAGLCAVPFLISLFISLGQGNIAIGSRTQLNNSFQDRALSRSYTSMKDLQLVGGSGFSRKFIQVEGETKFNIEADSHNLFLTTASAIGVIPSLILCGITFGCFWLTLNLIPMDFKNLFLSWALLLLAFSLIGGSMFSLPNSLDRFSWVVLGYSFCRSVGFKKKFSFHGISSRDGRAKLLPPSFPGANTKN